MQVCEVYVLSISFFLARPNSPTNVNISVIRFEGAIITWGPPDNLADFDFQHYQINLPDTVYMSSDTQITIEGLSPGEYDVSVMAITECSTPGVPATSAFSVGRLLLTY